MYSKKVIDHFTNPRNVGELDNPDGVGKMGNPTCLVPRTLIQSNPDNTVIESLETNDNVLTNDGYFHPINKIYKREYSGEVLTIKNRLGETTLTPEHECYAVKWSKTDHFRRLDNRKKLKPAWYHAFELEKEDMILYPIIKETADKRQISTNVFNKKYDHRSNVIPEILEITNDFLRLCGYYLAEGYVRLETSKSELSLSFGSHEIDLIQDAKYLFKDIFNLDVNIVNEGNCTRVHVYNVHVARFFHDLLGKGALNKQIPHWMLLLPVNKQKSLISGLWKGDGYFNINKPRAGYSTISRKLINGLKILLLRQQIIPSIYTEEDKTIDGIQHQKCFRIHIGHRESLEILAQILNVTFETNKSIKNDAWIDQDFLYIPITDIQTNEYSGLVHNFEVTQNHSYVSENLTLHNCGDLMWVYIKVNPDTEIIEDISVKTFGCAAAIATSSMITELAKGKHIDEAYELSRKDVASSLDGLPPIKMHCSNLSADALHKAIEDYREKKSSE